MYNFNEVEEEILKFWKTGKIFDKLRKKNKGKAKWRFIDGPITANNPMGVHHAWGRTYKDLFHRFKAMQGHEMRYQNGFDCQGLWVEREEEKALGLNSKDDIEKFGIKKFVEACKARVKKFSKIQMEQSVKLGYWMDWDNSYYTNTDDNNLHNWFLLKKYFDEGLLYKGHDVVPWCSRCGTASSKHDIVTEGYKEIVHDSVYIAYPIKARKNEFLLVWTTTPWTLPGNVAVAVDPEKEYAAASGDVKGNTYYLLKSVAEKLGMKAEKTLKGEKLIGLEYESPFDDLPRVKSALGNYVHKKVVAADGKAIVISDEEGTGMVHIAPGQGSEDFQLGKKLKLPAIELISENANYLDGMNGFSGKNAKKNPKLIFDYLENKDGGKYFFNKVSYKHRYPHCWRCGEELVFRLVDEWYIKCGKEVRKKLIDENRKVDWYPEYGKIRQEDWFKNMGDWLISRKRYYGLPLPIWECSCGNIEVIGSLEELKKKAVDKKKVDDLKELHRPWIDEIKIKCPKCGKEVQRIKDVGDAWLDAGIVPFSTLNYLHDKEYWKAWFPADLISENMPGQFRGWFNALFWASAELVGRAPFKAVFGYETLKDEKGREMHKSKGNAIWFDDAVEKIGADPMRLLYCLQDPSQELRFGFNVVKEPRNNINILFNIRKLVENSEKSSASKVEDKWILSKLNSLVELVTGQLEELHPHLAARALQDFWLNDFSRGYIQFVRDRISSGDKAALSVLKEVYTTLIKLCAPFIPFITEKAWQDLKVRKIVKEESVHLCDWPKADKKKIDKKLEAEFKYLFELLEKGLAQRDSEKVGLKWPLKSAKIRFNFPVDVKIIEPLIKSQLNIKEVYFEEVKEKGSRELTIQLDTKPTPELESEGYARELSRHIQAFRKKLGLDKKDKVNTIIFTDEDLKSILEKQIEFIKDRTNSKKLEIVTTGQKENFKNKTGFRIKDKGGDVVITTGR